MSKARIAARWEAAGAFRAGRPERRDAEPYCVVIPPPNVTGNLHMGHALNNTLQDVLCRYQRMNGRDVLWQPGTDHAGIATQMVVERQLAERQEADRRTLGREKFLARVWEWKAELGGAIVGQLKRLGASCDWSRERFTLDEGLSKAVAQGVRPAPPRRPDLQGQAAGQLGPEVPDRDFRPRGRPGRVQGLVQVEPRRRRAARRGGAAPRRSAADPNGHLYYFDYPVVDAQRRGDRRGRHRRDDAAGDDARRQRGRGPSRRRAVSASRRRATCACRWSGG